MSLNVGTRIGSYEIVGAIGVGGMGEVYRARDTKLGRDVAIKILPASFASDPDRLARFEREARILASLNHPNIADIYGLEESDGVARWSSSWSTAKHWCSGLRDCLKRFTRGVEGVASHAWLPDSRHVVVSYIPFARQVGGNDLGILDIEDGTIARVTMTVGDGFGTVSTSADGSRLMVTKSRIVREVWKAPIDGDPDANGRAAIRLLDATRDPMWTFVSRDGRTLLFNSSASGSRNLWTAPIDGSAPPRQITRVANDAVAHSSLSPDGSQVAFASITTGNSDIWTQDVDGSGLRQLTNDAAADSWPVWSPDGRWIMFSSIRDRRETWRVPADGGAAEKVVDGFFRGDWIANPAGEGTRLVTSDGGNELRLIDVDRRAVIWDTRAPGANL